MKRALATLSCEVKRLSRSNRNIRCQINGIKKSIRVVSRTNDRLYHKVLNATKKNAIQAAAIVEEIYFVGRIIFAIYVIAGSTVIVLVFTTTLKFVIDVIVGQ